MRLISTNDLAQLAGISKSHLQRLAAEGCIPDSCRTAGGHWQIKDTAKVRHWAAQRKKTRECMKRAQGKKFLFGPKKTAGAVFSLGTAGGHVANLMRFQREIEGNHWFDSATPYELMVLLKDIRPAVEFYLRVNRAAFDCGDEDAAEFAKKDLQSLLRPLL